MKKEINNARQLASALVKMLVYAVAIMQLYAAIYGFITVFGDRIVNQLHTIKARMVYSADNAALSRIWRRRQDYHIQSIDQ